MVERTLTFGNNPGTPFPEYTDIRSIALSGGSFLDRIIINGVAYGGPGGTETETLSFAPDEYIRGVRLRSGGVIDSLEIYTSKHQYLRAGGYRGQLHHPLWDGRLLGISGLIGPFKAGETPLVARLTLHVEEPHPIPDDGSAELAWAKLDQEILTRRGDRSES